MSLRRNSSYSSALSVIRLAVSVASIPILTRGLGLKKYGVWVVLLSVFNLSALLQPGLSPATSYYLAQTTHDRDLRSRIAGASLLLFAGSGVLVGSGIAIASNPITSRLFHGMSERADAASAMRLIGLTVFLQYIRQWLMSVESGIQRFDLQAWAEGAGAVLLYGGLSVVVLAGYGLLAMAEWLVLATVGTILVHFYFCAVRSGSKVVLKYEWDPQWARTILRFGSRQWISLLSSGFFGQVDKLIVNGALGPSAAGLYAVGTSVSGRINELSAAPLQVVVPALAESRSKGDEPRLQHIYGSSFRLNALAAFGLCAIVMVFAQPLAALLTPTNAPKTVVVLRVLAYAYGMFSIGATGYYSSQGLGWPMMNARWGLIGGFLFLVVLSIAVDRFGLVGAAWSNAAFGATIGINFEVARRLGLAWNGILVNHLRYLACLTLSFFIASRVLTGRGLRPVPFVLALVLLSGPTLWLVRQRADPIVSSRPVSSFRKPSWMRTVRRVPQGCGGKRDTLNRLRQSHRRVWRHQPSLRRLRHRDGRAWRRRVLRPRRRYQSPETPIWRYKGREREK